MSEILIKSTGFILIILLSYLLKKRGIFKLEDKNMLAFMLLNINLPCIVISGFQNFQLELALLLAICFGVIANLGGVALGYLLSRKKPKEELALRMMSSAGFNIGIFTIPFVSGFLSPSALLGVLMFDIGNAVMVFGASAAITSAVVSKEKKNPLPALGKKLVSSVPFMTYMSMLVLYLVGVTLPSGLYLMTDIGAGATAFLAMVMIGIMIEFKIPKSEVKEVCGVLCSRYANSILFAVIFYCLPFPMELRKALILAVFSPVSTAGAVFSQALGCKPSLTGIVTSLSIIISIAAMIGIILFL